MLNSVCLNQVSEDSDNEKNKDSLNSLNKPLINIKKCFKILSSQSPEIINDLDIRKCFIDLKNYNFNSEKIDKFKVDGLNIEDVKFNLSKKLKEYFYIFQSDFIAFDSSDYSVSEIITSDYNKFNGLKFQTIDNYKSVFLDNTEIKIYYFSVFSLNSFLKFCNTGNFIFFNSSVFVYPPVFYQTFKLNNNLNNVKSNIPKVFDDIIIDVLKNNIINFDISKSDLDKYFFVSLNLNNINFIKQLINKTDKQLIFNLFKKYIFYIVKVSDYDILKFLSLELSEIIKQSNFDNLNKKGLNAFEYSLIKFKKDSDYFKFVDILKDFNYSRPKFILDTILKTNLIKKDLTSNFDVLLNDKIKNISKFDNMSIINSIILKCMYNDLNETENTITIQDIVNFIKLNISHINISILFDLIYKYSSVIVLKELLINQIIKFDPEVFKLLINMKQADYLFTNYKKEILKFSDILIYDLINDLNIYGIVFLIKFINPEIINIKDSKNNNLLHYLTNQNKDIEDKEDLQFKIFKFFIELKDDLITEINNDYETPIFNTVRNKNICLFNLNIEMNKDCIKFKNVNGLYLIHEIVKYDFFDGLQSYIKNKCSVEYLDLYNNSALLLAVKNKNCKMANCLLANNANKKVRDLHNNSIYHFIGLYGLKKINIKAIENNENNKNISVVNCIKNNIYYEWQNLN